MRGRSRGLVSPSPQCLDSPLLSRFEDRRWTPGNLPDGGGSRLGGAFLRGSCPHPPHGARSNLMYMKMKGSVHMEAACDGFAFAEIAAGSISHPVPADNHFGKGGYGGCVCPSRIRGTRIVVPRNAHGKYLSASIRSSMMMGAVSIAVPYTTCINCTLTGRGGFVRYNSRRVGPALLKVIMAQGRWRPVRTLAGTHLFPIAS